MADSKKPGRNERCSCGSGRKFKVCCGAGAAASPTASRGDAALLANVANVMRIAERFLRAKQHASAIEPLLQAARLAPGNAGILNDLGMAFLITGRLPDAIRSLRRAIELRPTSGDTHYNLGLALEQAGDRDGAVSAHRRAIELAPQLAEAHGRLAELLLQRGLPRDAAAAFDRASSAAPGKTLGLLAAAKALMVRNRPAEAQQRLRLLLAREPSCSEARTMLGILLAEEGDFDGATATFEQCLAPGPWQATAYHGLVSSKRITPADRPLVARLVECIDASPASDRHQMTLQFAGGKAKDDLGDYEGAMLHFARANEIRRRLARPFDRDQFEQLISGLISRFTGERLSSLAATEVEETPLLVLGLPRSGTTLVERIVSSHPRVAGGGELVFWNERAPAWMDATPEKASEMSVGLRADYLEVLREVAPDALRVTDKMPFNFLWVGLVHLLFPRARIIHCRRHAVDTCLSMYTTLFAQSWGFASDLGDLASYYRQYRRLMAHWRAVLPVDRLLDVDYEEVTAAPEASARRMLEFAGLEWDAACLVPERNATAVKTASKWQARQPIYRSSVDRWRRYEPWIGELRELVADE